MLRVSPETRDRIIQLGRDEFDGASVEETLRRLLDEHWRATALAAVRQYRESNPDGWSAYLGEAETLSTVDAPITDSWITEA